MKKSDMGLVDIVPVWWLHLIGSLWGDFLVMCMFFKNADELFIHLVATSALNYLRDVFEDTVVYRWKAVHN